MQLWPIVRDAFVTAPASIRAQVKWVALVWTVVVAAQLWDSADASGAAGAAEFLSAMLGSTGAALLGIAHALHQTMGTAGRPGDGARAAAVEQVLLALPALAFAAGVALGGAATAMAVRVFLGVEIPLAVVGLVFHLLLTAFAGLTVMRSVRTLYEHVEEQATSAARARADAADAQLAALQARMNPHFLFNALNTVAALVRTEPGAAERCVDDLSDVLRMTLERSAAALGTVGEEIEYVRAYLRVEQQRWGERLLVEWDVAPGIEQAPLPTFVLQPIVENALRHGLGGRTSGGRIAIRIRLDGGALRLTVEDDGVGFPPVHRDGTGLGNLRERLAALYGDAASLAIDRGAGARVSVTIPADPHGAAAPGASGIIATRPIANIP